MNEAEIVLDRLEGYVLELKKINWNNSGWFGALEEIMWFVNQQRMRFKYPNQLEAKPVGEDYENTYIVHPVQEVSFKSADLPSWYPPIVASDIPEEL